MAHETAPFDISGGGVGWEMKQHRELDAVPATNRRRFVGHSGTSAIAVATRLLSAPLSVKLAGLTVPACYGPSDWDPRTNKVTPDALGPLNPLEKTEEEIAVALRRAGAEASAV